MNHQKRTALVTGASRGIGRAVALRLAEDGIRIALHFNRNHTAAKKNLSQLKGKGHELFRGDFSDSESIKILSDTVIERMDSINILVNNAGIYDFHDPAGLSFDEWRKIWDKMLQVNLTGPAHLSFLVSKHMIEHGGGKIINISSRGAFRGEPRAPAYGAAKAGLNAMGQSFAQSLAPYHVYVYTIAPGYIETDMTKAHLQGPEGEAIRGQSPLNRAGRPEEVAEVVAFLAGGKTDYLTGTIIDVNGASYLRT
ncbi:MAG TPA: SDR family oxidoreductase [bacterium]|nr:SDR family oxidoreductase [bacterium]